MAVVVGSCVCVWCCCLVSTMLSSCLFWNKAFGVLRSWNRVELDRNGHEFSDVFLKPIIYSWSNSRNRDLCIASSTGVVDMLQCSTKIGTVEMMMEDKWNFDWPYTPPVP